MATSSEKSTFSQTCNRLSQFIKNNRSFKDLTLHMPITLQTNVSPETSTTMELFPTNVTPKNITTKDFFTPNVVHPQQPQFPNSSAFSSKDSKTAQLTMFYNGQVIVLDNFPAEKVEELKSFARMSQTRETIVDDFPIARKASLHRFMDKRKHRICAKAPYYKPSNSISAPAKSAESNPWLMLGAKSM